ncbi:MAG TPA: MASE1 domain-containing protein [Rhizomicrobium sp.]|nr:MASE1 domain-containing protein [Rhizomicrobium sp.]
MNASLKSLRIASLDQAALLAAFVLTYGLAYEFGMAFGHRSPSPFWIPDSVLLTALLRAQPRAWSVLIASILPIRLALGLTIGLPFPYLIGTWIVDSATCLATAMLLRRLLADPLRFASLAEFIYFVVVAVLAIPAIGAFAGGALLAARGYPFWSSWLIWFLGVGVAQLVVTPFILYCVVDTQWLRVNRERLTELVIIALCLIVTNYLAANTATTSGYFSESRFYAPAPFVLWAAIRFGMPGATAGIMTMAFFFLVAAIEGRGPFIARPQGDVALALQDFLFLRAVTVYVIAIAIDQRRHAEGQLRESEERFRRMAQCAPVLLWMSGTDKLCNFFNKGWLEFTGRTLEQEMGNGWAEGVHAEDVKRCVAYYEDAFNAREPFEMEYRLRRHDGEYRWVLDIGVPRYEADGTFAGYIGSAIDITDRKRSEDMRRALAHTQRLAVMGELTAAIAHEVRQPMSAILLDSQTAEKLAQNDNLSAGMMREIASGIRLNATRVDTVMGRILGYLRKQDPQAKPLDINAVVQEVLHLVQGDAMRRSVQLKPELARNLPLVHADRTQLEQVLLNLIVNGMEAMESVAETARQLTVKTTSGGNGSVEVAVTDCGTGIAPEKLPLLFDSFFTTRKEGMGLGLSIAKSIVVAHHGRIWAENNRSSGATFRFTLPVANDEARARAG